MLDYALVIHRTHDLYVVLDLLNGDFGVKMYGRGMYSDGYCFTSKEDAIDWCEEQQYEINLMKGEEE